MQLVAKPAALPCPLTWKLLLVAGLGNLTNANAKTTELTKTNTRITNTKRTDNQFVMPGVADPASLRSLNKMPASLRPSPPPPYSQYLGGTKYKFISFCFEYQIRPIHPPINLPWFFHYFGLLGNPSVTANSLWHF